MKKEGKNKILLVFCFTVFLYQSNVFAQNNPRVLPLFNIRGSSISISNFGIVSLGFTTPVIAGMPLTATTDNSKWLNYAVEVIPPDPEYKIYVEISSGLLPDGVELQVQASPYIGSSGENPGTPTGVVAVSNFPQIIISNIGTCYTGSGINVGHQLTYSLIVNNYSVLNESFGTINLTYTISQ